MLILGLNAFHGDSAAALVKDGVLIAAAEEERFRRTKHWAGFPSQAIAYCLEEAGVRLADVDHVAVNQDSRANLFGKIAYVLRERPRADLVLRRLRNRSKRGSILELLAAAFPNDRVAAQFHPVEHHLAHLASAYFVSPFDEAIVLSIDGMGDFSSAAWGLGSGDSISLRGRVRFPHSLGIFYQAITQYLGFLHYGDEYKVMGLAPYGRPTAMAAMRDIVRLRHDGAFALDLKYFRHHREDVSFAWDGCAPETETLFSRQLEEHLGPRRQPHEPIEDRHRDIAHSLQCMYEEAFFHLLTSVQRDTGCKNVAMAGGCAMNSVANGKVRRRTPIERVYVQAAAGDAGGAIGSALAVWNAAGGKRRFVMRHAYWGPAYTAEDVRELLDNERARIEAAGCSVRPVGEEAALFRIVAGLLADGNVVGWFQGRMEWGPRALGNRSILGDPRRADMKERLNLKIKRRESFRPFAPSVLEEAVPDWFEESDEVPFMMQVFQIRAEKRALIPAVTHVDGSGRLQTVSREANARYYGLIEAFRDLTGVPMVLNTSFNENEPIVCQPREALEAFLRTKMDALVLGDVLVTRVADEERRAAPADGAEKGAG